MNYQLIDNIPVFGEPLQNAVDQMKTCSETAEYCALMADHHLGYSQPIGGVVAYNNHISPSGVGFDIACGNKAVMLECDSSNVKENISDIMDQIFSEISFGIGRHNPEPVDHELFDDDTWSITEDIDPNLKQLARNQLGTVGSGNHYVDIFVDSNDQIWIGVHFGSRGLGHKIATYFIKQGGGKDGINEPPTLIDVDSQLGKDYLACMELAGKYAYAGRDWVCQKVADILNVTIVSEVHNHHNFAWKETHFDQDLWIIRKGATPAFPNQLGFVGASMGENSVILKGKDSESSKHALYSTVHGAGRVLSRTQAAGKRRWKKGKHIQKSEGCITTDMMHKWINESEVELRGAGTDESPHCYKRLDEVLSSHQDTIEIINILKPIGVAMAGSNEYDPYKD